MNVGIVTPRFAAAQRQTNSTITQSDLQKTEESDEFSKEPLSVTQPRLKKSWRWTMAREGLKIGLIVGASLLFGPIGSGIVAGLISAVEQYRTHGRIRIGQTLIEALLGAIPGGVGSTVARLSTQYFKSLAQHGLKQFVLKGIIAGAVDGGLLGFLSGWLHTWYEEGFDLKKMLKNAFRGSASGVVLGGAFGGIAHGAIHATGIVPVKPNSLTAAELPKMNLMIQIESEKMELARLGRARFHTMIGSAKALRQSELGITFSAALDKHQVDLKTVLLNTLEEKNAKGAGAFGTFLEIPQSGFEQYGIKIFDADTPYVRSFFDLAALQNSQGLFGGLFRNMFTFGSKTSTRIQRAKDLLQGDLRLEPVLTKLNGLDKVSQDVALITNETGDVVAAVMKKVPGKSLLDGINGTLSTTQELQPFLQKVAALPQEAFDALIETVSQLKKRGVALDFQHPGNILVDDATKRFGLVDIAEDSLLAMGQSSICYRQLLQVLLGKANGKTSVVDLLAGGNGSSSEAELKKLVQIIVERYQSALQKHQLSLTPNSILERIRFKDDLDKLLPLVA